MQKVDYNTNNKVIFLQIPKSEIGEQTQYVGSSSDLVTIVVMTLIFCACLS